MNNIIQNNNVESFSMNNSHIIEEEFNNLAHNTEIDSKTKILLVLEAEYNYLEQAQRNLIYSNKEMHSLLPNDDIVIESIEINTKIFNDNIMKMKKIKKKVNLLMGGGHYICKKKLPVMDKYSYYIMPNK